MCIYMQKDHKSSLKSSVNKTEKSKIIQNTLKKEKSTKEKAPKKSTVTRANLLESGE